MVAKSNGAAKTAKRPKRRPLRKGDLVAVHVKDEHSDAPKERNGRVVGVRETHVSVELLKGDGSTSEPGEYDPGECRRLSKDERDTLTSAIEYIKDHPPELAPAETKETPQFEIGDIVAVDGSSGEIGVVEHIHVSDGCTNLIVRGFNQDGCWRNCLAYDAKDSVIVYGTEDMDKLRSRSAGKPVAVSPDGSAELPPRPEIADWDYMHSQLWCECESLFRIMQRNLPQSHDLLSHFEFALESPDDRAPQIERLRECRQRFYELPLEQQQRILSGWLPDPEMVDPRETLEMLLRDGCSQRFLLIRVDGKRVQSFQQYEFSEDSHPVQIRISLGTSKDRALSELEAAADFVKLHFEDAIRVEICDPSSPAEGKAQP